MSEGKFDFKVWREKPIAKIQDSMNQFAMIGPLSGLKTIEEIRESIAKNGLKHLEDYTKETTEFFDKGNIGVCEKYNSIVDSLKDPNLTMEQSINLKKELEIINKNFKDVGK